MEGFDIEENVGPSYYIMKRIADRKLFYVKQIHYVGLSIKEKELTVDRINMVLQIRNPKMIKYHHCIVDSDNGDIYIPTDYYGETLHRRINQYKDTGKQFSEEEIWQIITSISLCLYELHHNEPNTSYHGGLHSDSIFFDENGDIKISGLSFEPFISSIETPQQRDIYDLGVLIYIIATLSKTDRGNRIFEHKIAHLSTELKEFVLKATNPNPSLRFEVRDILEIRDVAVFVLEEKIRIAREENEMKTRRVITLESEIALREKKLEAAGIQIKEKQ